MYRWAFCVFVATYRKDYRLAKICVESVRHFYPDVPIVIMQDGDFDLSQLLALEGVERFDDSLMPPAFRKMQGAFGKLKLLVNPYAERFLYLDADTVLVAPIVELLDYQQVDFYMVPSHYDLRTQVGQDNLRKYQFDMAKIQEYDPDFVADELTLFNTGAWFGRTHVLDSADILRAHAYYWSQDEQERRRFSSIVEQGMLGYLIAKAQMLGQCRVETSDFEIRPAPERRAQYPNLSLQRVIDKSYRDHTHLHYTNPRRRIILRQMAMGEIPFYFNQRFPFHVQWWDDLRRLPLYWAVLKRVIRTQIRQRTGR